MEFQETNENQPDPNEGQIPPSAIAAFELAILDEKCQQLESSSAPEEPCKIVAAVVHLAQPEIEPNLSMV